MSDCKQKFLGRDSIDVLIKYIDSKIEENSSDVRVCTLQLFKYFKSTDVLNRPSNDIYYDFDTAIISFPKTYDDSWNTLAEVMKTLEEDALSKGSIYTSTRVQQGITAANPDDMSMWSAPVKISGVNGKSGAEFRFSSLEVCPHEKRGVSFDIPTKDNPFVYFWTLDENGIWPADDVKGKLWMKYTTDGKDGIDGNEIHYQYFVTSIDDIDDDKNPIAPNDSVAWVDSMPTLSKENPYLWVRTQQTVAGIAPANNNWSTPKLLSTVGQDGTVPDYTVNLYCKGSNTDDRPAPIGIIPPVKPELVEDSKISDYITEDWMILPGEDEGIWWQITFNVRGMDDKVLAIGDVKRYNGVDGTALPGEYTKMLFKWSENQLAPEIDKSSDKLVDGWKPEGWNEDPNVDIIEAPEASIWMIVCNINGVTDAGMLNVVSISDPVKITGPRGSLSYDYRIEMRYYCGGETAPKYSPTQIQWNDKIENVDLRNPKYPYLWAYPVLVYYKMRYGELKEDGTYDVEVYGNGTVVSGQNPVPFRMSGINGSDGNTKNNILVSAEASTASIENFTENNYFIFTGSGDMTYNLSFSEIDFISGYTGKFVNAGSGNVTINATGKYTLIGSGKSASDKITSLVLNTGESVELIVYNDTENSSMSYIVVGKEI